MHTIRHTERHTYLQRHTKRDRGAYTFKRHIESIHTKKNNVKTGRHKYLIFLI